jgi:hypothetical protein
MLTLRTNDFSHVLPELVQHIRESGVSPRLVRVEGVMGAGKTALADMLAGALSNGDVLHVDRLASPDESNRPYAASIDISALHAHLTSLLQKATWTILDAVCLDEVAPEATFGRGFVIYVKRVSVVGPDIHLWHGFDEGAAVPEHPLFRSIHCYHMRFRPHEKADVLLVHPEELHSFDDRAPRS